MLLGKGFSTIRFCDNDAPPPIHLAQELFICGPVHTWWMYPFERYLKVLKGYVKNKAKPEGSMACGYTREESVGFMTEFLSQYTPTRKRAWDDEEEPTMKDEVTGVSKRDRPMDAHFIKIIHGFVLDNTTQMEDYRRRYEQAVSTRAAEREQYRREYHRRRRRARLVFPAELRILPDFADWISDEVSRDTAAGADGGVRVADTARGPLPVATAYKTMTAFGTRYRILSAKRHLKTANSGLAVTFRQVFYSEADDSPRWKVVLRKEVRGKRVIPNNEDHLDDTLFYMGDEEDFIGLRPQRNWEEPIPTASTGRNVVLQEVLMPSRGRTGGRLRGRGGS